MAFSGGAASHPSTEQLNASRRKQAIASVKKIFYPPTAASKSLGSSSPG